MPDVVGKIPVCDGAVTVDDVESVFRIPVCDEAVTVPVCAGAMTVCAIGA